MKLHQVKVFGLVGVSILLSMQIGCRAKHRLVVSNPDRTVTISVDVDHAGKCEVDFPVTLVRASKHHSITWGSEDNNYWIKFDSGGSPIDPSNKSISIPGLGSNGPNPIPPSATIKYYKYAIYLADPDTNSNAPECKAADDDHDTGVNVKR
jgi:hypothetical protein